MAGALERPLKGRSVAQQVGCLQRSALSWANTSVAQTADTGHRGAVAISPLFFDCLRSKLSIYRRVLEGPCNLAGSLSPLPQEADITSYLELVADGFSNCPSEDYH
jgi:hypothetical protein